jgi:hypothetical protein
MANRHHSTRRAAGLHLIRFHRQDQPPTVVFVHIKHVHAGNIEDRIGSGAPARTRATHRVGHRRVLRGKEAWSPLILKAPTPLLGDQHATARHAQTTVNSEDPHLGRTRHRISSTGHSTKSEPPAGLTDSTRRSLISAFGALILCRLPSVRSWSLWQALPTSLRSSYAAPHLASPYVRLERSR